jgi:hypothetical protein
MSGQIQKKRKPGESGGGSSDYVNKTDERPDLGDLLEESRSARKESQERERKKERSGCGCGF